MKKLVVFGWLVGAVCLLGTYACNRGDTSTNAAQGITDDAETVDVYIKGPASYVADSALRPFIVDTTSIALPMGSSTQVWTLAKTDIAWYSLNFRKDHWTVVDDLDIRSVDPSDSTREVARAFVEAHGGMVVREALTASRSIRFLHVDLIEADSLGYVPAAAPLPAILAEYAREGTFIYAMGLADETPISQSILQ